MIGVVVAIVKIGVLVAIIAGVVACGELVETVAGIIAVGAGAEAGIIIAAVPAFIVAPHAPSEVFITPPSIYIHFGAVVVILKNIKFIAEKG